MENFLVHNAETKAQMLAEIGMQSIDDLFAQIPTIAVPVDFEKELGKAKSELETQKIVKKLAAKNNLPEESFLGAGCYNKFTPACVLQTAQRWEFLTAYTPYQAEISQGTLQVMYEFQTMMCRLTGMDIANATVYDGATACAEAILMAARISKKTKALVHANITPEYEKVINTYAWAKNIEIEKFSDELPANLADYACVLVQTPDYYGEILKTPEVDGTLLIVCTNLSALSILEPPINADIVVGDIQPLGIPQSFGGPYAGVIACKEKYMRQLPGRLAGRTVDTNGNTAYCLTIQTREQHIKREKATSNICSNQALMGLCAALYLTVMGEKGFKQAGYLSAKNAHKLASGLNVENKNFFNEFVFKVADADATLKKLKENGIAGGIKLSATRILTAVTEMNSDEAIEKFIEIVNN
ncbi:MAG: aminomethyl-transferring glycine dehydrogenase subunit GcvPA [Fusobacterium sp.]|nr:aminomethyl-transferring glycine dehydrogenase subunit GcvPA [Fusobacterium sp.]